MTRPAPLVAVISPCRDQAAFVGEMIASVQAQTLTSWALVVVDDGSSDETFEIAARSAGADARVRALRIEPTGVAGARRAGYAGCPSAEFALFLDSDDVLEPTMLHRLVTYLQEHPGAGAVHCLPSFIDADGRPLAGEHGFAPRRVPTRWGVRVLGADEPETPFFSILTLTGLIPSITLFRTAAYERAGGWAADARQGFEDTDLFLRLALAAPLHHLAVPLVRHRRHAGQHSHVWNSEHDMQLQRLYERWRDTSALPSDQAAIVERAWRAYDLQWTLASSASAAVSRLRRRQPVQAARFAAGGVRIVVRGLGRRWFRR